MRVVFDPCRRVGTSPHSERVGGEGIAACLRAASPAEVRVSVKQFAGQKKWGAEGVAQTHLFVAGLDVITS